MTILLFWQTLTNLELNKCFCLKKELLLDSLVQLLVPDLLQKKLLGRYLNYGSESVSWMLLEINYLASPDRVNYKLLIKSVTAETVSTRSSTSSISICITLTLSLSTCEGSISVPCFKEHDILCCNSILSLFIL